MTSPYFNVRHHEHLRIKQKIEKLKISLFNGKLELVKQSRIGKKILRLSKGYTAKSVALNKQDWQEFEHLIIQFFPELYQLIAEATSRSSVVSFRLCMLSFFKLSTKTEAFMLEKTDVAIRQNLSRLRKSFNIDHSNDLFSFYEMHEEGTG